VAVMDRSLARKLVALAAAYAVALNMLLPALTAIASPAFSSPATGGALGLEVICSGGAGPAAGRGVPEKPQPLCPCCGACAMPGCAATVLPDIASSSAGAPRMRAQPVGLSREGRHRQTFWPGGSKLARGPPVA
jgi:hypothetical protein